MAKILKVILRGVFFCSLAYVLIRVIVFAFKLLSVDSFADIILSFCVILVLFVGIVNLFGKK